MILKLAILSLGPQNGTLLDFRVKRRIDVCFPFSRTLAVPCYTHGLHIRKLVSHNTLVTEMSVKMLWVCIVSDVPRLLVPVVGCLVQLSHLED